MKLISFFSLYPPFLDLWSNWNWIETMNWKIGSRGKSRVCIARWILRYIKEQIQPLSYAPRSLVSWIYVRGPTYSGAIYLNLRGA